MNTLQNYKRCIWNFCSTLCLHK